jgi:hypothetical protein
MTRPESQNAQLHNCTPPAAPELDPRAIEMLAEQVPS